MKKIIVSKAASSAILGEVVCEDYKISFCVELEKVLQELYKDKVISLYIELHEENDDLSDVNHEYSDTGVDFDLDQNVVDLIIYYMNQIEISKFKFKFNGKYITYFDFIEPESGEVIISYTGNGFTFEPDDILTSKQEKELISLMLEKKYTCLTVDVLNINIVNVDVKHLPFDYKENKEYVNAVYDLENILKTKYAGEEFTLICNGFDIESWNFKCDDLDTEISEELESSIVFLMSVLNIDYVKINWDGSEFKEFFPIDVFSKIVELQDMFEIATFNKNGEKMIELSNSINDLCEALAAVYNDECYLNLAIEYLDMLDLIQTLEIQESLLIEYFTNESIKTDEITMLYKDFMRNLDLLEAKFPGSPFVANMVLFEKDFNNLVEVFELSEQGFQASYYQLVNYLKDNYPKVFTINYSNGEIYIDDEEAASDAKLKLIFTIFRDIACSENVQLTWDIDKVYEIISDEIPYESADILPLSSEYWDEYKEPREVTDVEIMNHFMFPLDENEDASNMFKDYAIVDLSYTGPAVMPGMENVTNEDWAKYLDPDEHSQFREKWFYDEVVGEPEELEEDATEDDVHVDALILSLNSLSGMNLSKDEEAKFITKELMNLNFSRDNSPLTEKEELELEQYLKNKK